MRENLATAEPEVGLDLARKPAPEYDYINGDASDDGRTALVPVERRAGAATSAFGLGARAAGSDGATLRRLVVSVLPWLRALVGWR